MIITKRKEKKFNTQSEFEPMTALSQGVCSTTVLLPLTLIYKTFSYTELSDDDELFGSTTDCQSFTYKTIDVVENSLSFKKATPT